MLPLIVSPTVWVITIIIILALFAFDYFFHVRKAHTPTIGEAAKWSAIYISIAILFGIALWIFVPGHEAGVEYFAGWVTEESLSIDNLFVFLVIMSSFKVPRKDQQKVLLFGIFFALISRSVLIALGAAIINRFSWAFYLFGLFLIFTAIHLVIPSKNEKDEADNAFIRFMKKHMNTTDYYDGDKLTTIVNGKRYLTPMLLVMLSIGFTDVLFAFDSVPAIYGLTEEPFIVFSATAFSLLGLRQLYFLIDGLLDRLVYLSYGLSAILGLIGIKLVLHALHANTLPFLNDGQPLHIPEISTGLSLGLILAILAITIALSLLTPSGRALTVINTAKRYADEYLTFDDDIEPGKRKITYKRMELAWEKLPELSAKYRKRWEENDELKEKFDLARELHKQYLKDNSQESN